MPQVPRAAGRGRGPFGLRTTLVTATVAAAFLVVGSLVLLEVELVDQRLQALVPHLDPASAERIRAVVRTVLVFGAVAAVAVAGSLGLLLGRLLVVPLERLTRHARTLQAGQLGERLGWSRRDELGELAEALDAMAEELRRRIASLRAERERLSAVLDAMAEGVAVTDGHGRIERANPALRRLLGEEVDGRLLTEVLQEEPLREAWRRARRGEPNRLEGIALRDASGRERTVDVEAAPLGGRGVVLVLHDVTERRRAERARRDFVAAASHELRTPLTVVGGYAETLLEEVDDPALRRRFAERILEHTRRMQRLAQDLLALSRAEADEGRLPLEPVSLPEALRAAWERHAEAAAGRGVELRTELPETLPEALGTPAAVQTILSNLLENAVRHGPDGRPIVARGGVDERGRPWIEVADEGPGIAPEHHERIFERFYRVDRGRSRAEGGTGLGLALVKHLSARLGATVSVDSAPGQGARFRVRFQPAAARGERPGATSARA